MVHYEEGLECSETSSNIRESVKAGIHWSEFIFQVWDKHMDVNGHIFMFCFALNRDWQGKKLAVELFKWRTTNNIHRTHSQPLSFHGFIYLSTSHSDYAIKCSLLWMPFQSSYSEHTSFLSGPLNVFNNFITRFSNTGDSHYSEWDTLFLFIYIYEFTC